MFFLQPIMILTYIVLISLYSFNHYLQSNKVNSLYISVSLLIVSILLFLIRYTDRLLETVTIVILLALVAGLCYLPCKMADKQQKHYKVVYVITHFVAFSILGGLRIMLLVASPFYYFIPLLGFSTLYILRKTPNKIIASVAISTLIVLRAMFPFDYEVPFSVKQVDFFTGYYSNLTYSKLNDSKAKIKGVEYYKKNYGNNIKDVICIYKENKTAIILVRNSKNKNIRLVYEDGLVREE